MSSMLATEISIVKGMVDGAAAKLIPTLKPEQQPLAKKALETLDQAAQAAINYETDGGDLPQLVDDLQGAINGVNQIFNFPASISGMLPMLTLGLKVFVSHL
jgi:hypothetical protein